MMTLRDRIAKAIFLSIPAEPVINSVECYGMADAVIAALQGIVFEGDTVESPEWGGRE